jgi:ABC-2 type transport system ATP-binding protein
VSAALEFAGISKRYRSTFSRQERWALRDFNLTIEPGEIVGFLGPNGAGKTTAINIALGLALPTKGQGTLLGRSFGNATARRQVGFLSENPAFYHRSARDTVRFYGALNGVPEPELSRRTNQLLEAVDLTDDAGRNINKFSRGMLQRVGIAQALINDPELLVLDEPTSALDPLSRLQLRGLLLDARDKGKAIFLSSHQLSEIELISDRVVFVQAGRVIASGRTREFLERYDEFEITASGLKAAPAKAENVKHEAGRWTFIVPASQQRTAVEEVWFSGGELISVTPKTRTLEQLFVELMKDRVDRQGRTQ